MEHLIDLGTFAVQALIITVCILFILSGLVSILSKNKDKASGNLIIKKLNDYYSELETQINKKILNKKQMKAWKKNKRLLQKQTEEEQKPRAYVLQFSGDMKASGIDNLREEITGLLNIATGQDEIIVRLESPGGLVSNYGLAASQLQRIRDRHIPLTVCIDKVAASGGYLMACVANKILAAPFAIIGSIGVIAQIPNFHRFLKKHDVDFEQVTAGDYKRTLTVFGENKPEQREKMQEELNTIHNIFKEFINQYRPKVDIDTVATGEYWLAKQAKGLLLVDELTVSDDYLLECSKRCDIYQITKKQKTSLSKRLCMQAQALWQSIRYQEPF